MGREAVINWPLYQVSDYYVSRGCLAPEQNAHNHFCVFIDKLEGSCTDPRANRVAPGAPNPALNSATAARRAPPNLRPLKSVMSNQAAVSFTSFYEAYQGDGST